MNILYDDNMPYAQQYFGSLNANSSGVVKSFTPNQIDDKDLLNCDALLVRSTTTVDAELIAKAPNLKYVATATAGFNHLDLQALEAANVSWYSAGGCNARAVAEYVISALLLLAERQDFCLADRSVALVGVGNVGKALSNLLSCLGIHVIEYDPPRASTDRAFVSASFEQVLAADIISLHVPFVAHGQYRTGHMFDSNILAKLNNTQILINASRGEVIDNQALLEGFIHRKATMPTVCLDCWENEPTIERALIEHLALCTAHIAGHSLEGKARGTDMVYQDLCRFFSYNIEYQLSDFLPEYHFDHSQQFFSENSKDMQANKLAIESIVRNITKCVYDIENDDSFFRRYMAKSPSFSAIRQNYPVRREWPAAQINLNNNKATQVLNKLGFILANDSEAK